jgi:hypothetical protein
MSIKLRLVWFVLLFTFAAAPTLRADMLEMQNGDRYSGKVLSMSADTVVLSSEVLGKINVPRNKVASLTFGTNSSAPKVAAAPMRPATTNLPTATASPALTGTNVDLSTAFRQLGANTNFVGQIRDQMFAGNPEAAAKYDAMVNGLLSGQLNLNDLRQQAQSAAAQLRDLKRGLGPDADESLDGYLKILDAFVNEAPPDPLP